MGQSKSFLSVPSLGKEIVGEAEGKEKENYVVKFDLMVRSFHPTIHLELVPSPSPAGDAFLLPLSLWAHLLPFLRFSPHCLLQPLGLGISACCLFVSSSVCIITPSTEPLKQPGVSIQWRLCLPFPCALSPLLEISSMTWGTMSYSSGSIGLAQFLHVLVTVNNQCRYIIWGKES